MTEKRNPKWQQEVEAILREQLREDKRPSQLAQMDKLIGLTQEVEPPSGDFGLLVARLLATASKELPPLTAVYAAFQMGVAIERYHNGSSAREP